MIPAARPPVPLRRTPLTEFHLRHGAHLVPFAGWEMPLYYTSILDEHRAVREGVGLFDVSHMGVLSVSGDHAAELLARRTTANVPRLTPGQVRYTFFLETTGGIVDDLLVSRLDDGTSQTREYLAVPNAGRADEVEEILRQHRLPDTTLVRWNGKTALLAVQGPRSRELLERTFGWDLSGLGFYRTAWFPTAPGTGDPKGRLGLSLAQGLGRFHLVSRTGYTGERGYEIVLRAEESDSAAERIVTGGAVPVGLAARDTPSVSNRATSSPARSSTATTRRSKRGRSGSSISTTTSWAGRRSRSSGRRAPRYASSGSRCGHRERFPGTEPPSGSEIRPPAPRPVAGFPRRSTTGSRSRTFPASSRRPAPR